MTTSPFDRFARWCQRSPGWRTALLRGAAFGTVTGSLVALIDGGATLLGGLEGNPLWFLIYSWALLVLWTGCLGIAFAVWLELLRHGFERGVAAEWTLLRRRALWVLRCTAAMLPVLAFVWWVPWSWVSEHWEELASRARALVVLTYFLLFLGTLSLSLVASWLARRHARAEPPRLYRLLLPALLLVAAACYAADRLILVGLYEDFHYGLFGGFLLSLAGCAVLVVAPSGRGLALLSGLLGLASVTVVGSELASVDVLVPARSLAFSKLVATGRTLTDFDHDGVSGWFGGSDCNGFDADSGPGKFDFPGNGKDEDCSGSDARWPEPRPRIEYPVPDGSGHDVVLITVDALRADHLGLHGYARNTSPNLDALARRSLVFERAFAPAPKTWDSLPAFFTGLYPSNLPRDYSQKKRDPRWRKSRFDERGYVFEIGADAALLAERFQRRGYHTVGCSHVALLPLLGLARGFDRFVQAESCRDALAGAKERPEPLFFWAHLFAPHAPYSRHPEFNFGDSALDRYDGEVAKDDAEIGALLALHAERGRADRSIVVVSADHGEEFREHGGEFHGLRLYRELIHVPLLLHIPGIEPRRVAAPVELMSLTPTLCELARLEGPCDDYDSVSLLRTMQDPGSAQGAVAEVYRRDIGTIVRSLYTDRWHLLLDLSLDRVELYDVVLDTNEQRNVAQQHPDIVASLREELQGRIQYRAARVFEAYASEGDPVRLAQRLPVLQDERLLRHALDELEQHLSPALAEHLQRLAQRPGLPDDLRALALAAAAAAAAAGPSAAR